MEEYKKFGATDLFMLSAVLFWAINFSFIKIALREISPLGFNGIRLCLSSVFLISFLLFRGENLRIPKSDLWKIVSMSITGNTVFQMLFIHGINLTTASNTSIIMAMTPIFIALLSSFLKHEKISWAGWTGIFFSFIGFYLVIIQQNGNFGFSWQRMKGDLMIFGGNFCWAYYTVLAKPLLEKMSPLKLTSITMAIGAVFFLPFASKDVMQIPWATVSFQAWGGLLYSTLFALTICYVIWYASVKRVGNSKTAIYNNISPIFTILFAYIILSERMTPIQIVGAIIILGGVYLTRFGYRFFVKEEN